MAEAHGFYGKLVATHPDGGPIGVWRLGAADYNGYARAGPKLIDAVKEGFIVHLEDILQSGRAASIRSNHLVRGRLVIDGRGLGLGTLKHIGLILLHEARHEVHCRNRCVRVVLVA